MLHLRADFKALFDVLSRAVTFTPATGRSAVAPDSMSPSTTPWSNAP